MSEQQQQQHQEETATLLPIYGHNNEQKRKDWRYYLIWLWRFVIFGLTGSSSVHVTRMLLALVKCPSNVKKRFIILATYTNLLLAGTWYYYVAFFFAEFLVYTVMIILLGTVFFQWRFFCMVAFKMWSWLLPRKIKNWCHERLYSHTMPL